MLDNDIDDCKTSKLYDIGRVQGYGVLLAIDVASRRIVGCSENILEQFGFGADQLMGSHYSAFVQSTELDDLLDSTGQGRHRFWQTTVNERHCFCSAHSDRMTAIIEIEPSANSFAGDYNSRIGFMHDLALMKDPAEAAEFLMNQLAGVIGFDRVMLYRFLPGWHGVVLAEKLNPGVQGFLNLHFPAGDVPENARSLYTINLQRYIADTEDKTAGILVGDIAAPFDLTYSQLRAVHPVHIEYLKNIGARSSFSVSLTTAGKLWGMIACHHQTQRQLDFSQRFYCEELSRMTSLHISGLVAVRAEKDRSQIHLHLANVEASIESSESADQTLIDNAIPVMAAFKADSVLVRVGDKSSVHGAMENAAELGGLRDWLDAQTLDHNWQTHEFPAALEPWPALKKNVSGVLYIPIGEDDYLALVRNEQVENQQWAGRPPSDDEAPGARLTPRSSFETWSRETCGSAEPWSELVLDMGAEFGLQLKSSFSHFRLERLAMQDSLTALPNRRKFELDLERVLKAAQKRPRSFAVYILDLDKFKQVNDTLGHASGDELLIEVGNCLRSVIRENDTVARLGGDEFALIQYNVIHRDDIRMVADRIIADLGQPFSLQQGKVNIGVSIGVAVYPDHGATADELLGHADAALYQVKNGGRNAWRFWTP